MLSPTLFNLVMALLLWRLAVVPYLEVTVYVDDITVWTMGSDNAHPPEKSIQRALDIVNDFPKKAGLRPFPEKTRYMAFGRNGRRSMPTCASTARRLTRWPSTPS